MSKQMLKEMPLSRGLGVTTLESEIAGLNAYEKATDQYKKGEKVRIILANDKSLLLCDRLSDKNSKSKTDYRYELVDVTKLIFNTQVFLSHFTWGFLGVSTDETYWYFVIAPSDIVEEILGEEVRDSNITDTVATTLEGAVREFSEATDVGFYLGADESYLATATAALAFWHNATRYCVSCGGLLQVANGGWAKVCAGCKKMEFPRTDPAVIVAVVDHQDRLLLVHNVAWAEERMMSLVAGFVEAGESPHRTVTREIFEEVGIKVQVQSYLGAQPWPKPRSLMLCYRAVTVEKAPVVKVDQVEITRGAFFTRDELLEEVQAGRLVLPWRTTVARWIIQDWYGKPLPQNKIRNF